MDTSHQPPGNTGFSVAPPVASHTIKRPWPSEDDPQSKKIKQTVEIPAVYSDAVRKKLASTSRTGQACDRCKERKMKCDTNPVACQPCRQKNLRCYTTDRVTGQARERGQTDRAETELQTLREQNAAYHRKYGPLQEVEYLSTPTYTSGQDSINDRSQSARPVFEHDTREPDSPFNVPDARYIGWPAPDHTGPLYQGPVNGTVVDIVDSLIDIADFPCESMDEYPISKLNVFNMSRTSVINTLTGYQNVIDPRFPSKDQAIQDATTFVVILSQFVPILHRSSFLQMVQRIYEQPDTVSQSERVQLAVVLGIVEHQMGTRNHKEAAEKFAQSHHHIHYALTYYRDLLRERTLASMQALALILVHFRNLPKPGYTWVFGHDVLVKALDADYHRDPDKVPLPPAENNILAKELRKRVFHSILGICITTECRVGRPAPWNFGHMDVPLPMAIKDSEINESGLIHPLSGTCDFWPCIQLAKLLPLLTEMYNHVISVRRSEKEYVKTVGILHNKIDAWRREWDESIRNEGNNHINLHVATLLVDGWAAEYALNLYHPALYPTRASDTMERHLDICHKQAQRLLKSFHTLSNKYKGVDFTWHSTVAYALGFGVTLHVYRSKKGRATSAQTEAMKNELKGWMSLVAYADLVLRTGNHLQHIFEPRVKKLELEYEMSLNTPRGQQDLMTTTQPSTTIPSRPYATQNPTQQPNSLGTISNKMEMPPNLNQHDLPGMAYSQATHIPTSQQWPTNAHYVAQTSSAAPHYGVYTTGTPQYHSLPNSLAPLLNDHSNNYIPYATPSSNQQNEMMMFQPTHYTDSPATTMWPLITLPQQDQGQQHNPNVNIKYN